MSSSSSPPAKKRPRTIHSMSTSDEDEESEVVKELCDEDESGVRQEPLCPLRDEDEESKVAEELSEVAEELSEENESGVLQEPLIPLSEAELPQDPKFTWIDSELPQSIPANISKFYIRRVFDQYFRLILTLWVTKEPELVLQSKIKPTNYHVCVSGTPSSGKSIFMQYFVHRYIDKAIELKKQVTIYARAYDNKSKVDNKQKWRYLKVDPNVDDALLKEWQTKEKRPWQMMDEAPSRDYFAENQLTIDTDLTTGFRNVLFVVDGCFPGGMSFPEGASVVIFSSPNDNVEKQFHERTHWKTFYWPPANWEEAQAIVKELYPHQTLLASQLEKRFATFGCALKWLLFDPMNIEGPAANNTFVSTVDRMVTNVFELTEDELKMFSDRTIHSEMALKRHHYLAGNKVTFVEGYPTKYTITAASELVQLLVIKALYFRCKENLEQMAGLFVSCGATATAYGCLYEAVVLENLQKRSAELTLTMCQNQTVTTKWRPTNVQTIACNHPTIDAYAIDANTLYLIQVTAAKTHSLKGKGLALLREQHDVQLWGKAAQRKCIFLWITPWESYRKQNPNIEGKQQMKDLGAEQYYTQYNITRKQFDEDAKGHCVVDTNKFFRLAQGTINTYNLSRQNYLKCDVELKVNT